MKVKGSYLLFFSVRKKIELKLYSMQNIASHDCNAMASWSKDSSLEFLLQFNFWMSAFFYCIHVFSTYLCVIDGFVLKAIGQSTLVLKMLHFLPAKNWNRFCRCCRHCGHRKSLRKKSERERIKNGKKVQPNHELKKNHESKRKVWTFFIEEIKTRYKRKHWNRDQWIHCSCCCYLFFSCAGKFSIF